MGAIGFSRIRSVGLRGEGDVYLRIRVVILTTVRWKSGGVVLVARW